MKSSYIWYSVGFLPGIYSFSIWYMCTIIWVIRSISLCEWHLKYSSKEHYRHWLIWTDADLHLHTLHQPCPLLNQFWTVWPFPFPFLPIRSHDKISYLDLNPLCISMIMFSRTNFGKWEFLVKRNTFSLFNIHSCVLLQKGFFFISL